MTYGTMSRMAESYREEQMGPLGSKVRDFHVLLNLILAQHHLKEEKTHKDEAFVATMAQMFIAEAIEYYITNNPDHAWTKQAIKKYTITKPVAFMKSKPMLKEGARYLHLQRLYAYAYPDDKPDPAILEKARIKHYESVLTEDK